MFGRHSGTAVADRDAAVEDRTDVIPTRTADDPAPEPDTEPRRTSVLEADRETGRDRLADEPVVEPVESKRWVHVSLTASVSLVIGVLAFAATLTGLLAPIGFAAGVLAVLVAALATYSVSRPNVTGHVLLVAGAVLGAAAIVLSLLAINGQLSWLSSDSNTITSVHTWLNDHVHWLRRW